MGAIGKYRFFFHYVIFEGDVLTPMSLARRLTLAEAFHRVMAHCAYEPVWEQRGEFLVLRYRHLEGPFEGMLAGEEAQGGEAEEHREPAAKSGCTAARERLMSRVLLDGVKGWYGMKEESFDSGRSLLESFRRSYLRLG